MSFLFFHCFIYVTILRGSCIKEYFITFFYSINETVLIRKNLYNTVFFFFFFMWTKQKTKIKDKTQLSETNPQPLLPRSPVPTKYHTHTKLPQGPCAVRFLHDVHEDSALNLAETFAIYSAVLEETVSGFCGLLCWLMAQSKSKVFFVVEEQKCYVWWRKVLCLVKEGVMFGTGYCFCLVLHYVWCHF